MTSAPSEPDRVRGEERSGPSLVALALAALDVAFVLSVIQLVLDGVARTRSIRSGPSVGALAAASLGALVGAAALALVVAAGTTVGEPRRRSLPSRSWLIVGTAGLLATIVARLSVSRAEPLVAPLAPLLLVGPAAFAVAAYRSMRRGRQDGGGRDGGRRTRATVALVALVGAVGLLSTVAVPARSMAIAVRSELAGGMGAALLIAGLVVATVELLQRQWATALRPLLVAAIGAWAHRRAGGLPARTAEVLPALALAAVAGLCWVRPGALDGGRRAWRRIGRLGPRARHGWSTLVLAPSSVGSSSVEHRAGRAERWGAAGMALGSALLVASGVWWAWRVGWQPTGHAATVMARAHDVGTVDHPLVGMITSYGTSGEVSHPGPIQLDLMAPFVRLLGVQAGSWWGGAFFTLGPWAVAVWAGWRAAGRTGALLAWAGGAVVIQVAMLGAVWEANNVSTTMMAMFACFVASWAAASGSARAWPWAVGLGSLCTQGYLPHGLVVIGPVVWSGLVLVGVRRTASDPERSERVRRQLRIGWVVGALAWSQPVLDAVLHDGGNLRALLDQASTARPTVGMSAVPRAVGLLLAVPPRWGRLVHSFATPGNAADFLGGSLWPGFVILVGLVVLAGRSWRRAEPAVRQLQVLAGLVLLGSCLGLVQLPLDGLRAFLLGWTVVASLCIWFAVVLSLAGPLRRVAAQRGEFALRSVRVVGALAAVGALLVAGFAAPDRIEDVKGRAFTIDPMVAPLVAQVDRNLDVDRPVLVLLLDSRLGEATGDTIISNLIVRGVQFRVQPTAGSHYGPHRYVRGGRWTGPMVWITSGIAPIDPDGRLLGAGSVPGWSRARWDALARKVAGRVRSAGAPVVLEPWALEQLPRYLAGWIGDDTCTVASEIAAGTRPVTDLPDGLLLELYADRAVASPTIGDAEQAEATDLLGQGPVEVWLVDRTEPGPIDASRLLRDDTSCPPAAGGTTSGSG